MTAEIEEFFMFCYGQEMTDVAVRSSATPDASFAGQQETFLT
jgi:phosphoenolpyruvate synthase/pyruvate phosphate dikinase